MKVKFLHYAETMQAINEEDDILMAMARELVTEKGIGKRADAGLRPAPTPSDAIREGTSRHREILTASSRCSESDSSTQNLSVFFSENDSDRKRRFGG